MEDKLLAVLQEYADGAHIGRVLKTHGISWAWFYKSLRERPREAAQYQAHKKARADMAGHKVMELAEICLEAAPKDENGVLIDKPDAGRVREAGNLLLKMMAKYDPGEYGDKVQVQTDVRLSLTDAIEAGRQRMLRPPCDPAQVIDAECVDITNACTPQASDKQSDTEAIAPILALKDPFEA
jgi:hypothetical protein